MSLSAMIDLAAKPHIHLEEGESVATASAHRSPHYERATRYMVVFSVWIGLFGWLANFDQAFGHIGHGECLSCPVFCQIRQQDVNSPNVAEQVEAVVCHIETERQLEQETSVSQLFRGLDLKRTHVAVLVLIGNALTGVQFAIPYTALFLSQIGISNPYTLNVSVSSAILAGCLPGAFLCEYLGRRLCLLGGYRVMEPVVHHDIKRPFEMHANRLRTMGQAYAIILYEIFSFGSAFWTPCMLNAEYGNMSTNVGYFYFGITIVIIVLTFLFVPETAKLSLEQVDEYFLGGEPAWKTGMAKNKRIAATG
ncbi:hypothetical protein NM208_g601 [Fusarium decemcellulare]|uniref:Uncharacterized protein n=1 Tax=Fusarium decemcellulare TaxID=57161 RepID=A0ACC1SYY1_9HYPO|nr:hypothetical protein NM208_g601 [Fusarium decemcellulare]